ncbi:MAG: hypothetical protein ACLQGP_16835 [Isosphaeraceae bacterium]
MSAKVDQFRDKMRHQLDTVEGRFKAVKANIQALHSQAEKSLREKLDEAHYELQAQKEHVQQTRANLKARAEQQMTETKEAVSEWKAKRETRKLNARADRAEGHAVDAIDYAAAMMDEGEEAILEAVVARLDADAAQSSAPAP